MTIVYTKHAIAKFELLKDFGWNITKIKIHHTLEQPRWRGVSRFGQATAMSLLDSKHILRVIFDRDGDILRVITFHPARRGTYESSL
ncbi:MAG: hypothetical protein Q8L37_05555 [Candidatus Gottesmanbacteria bacterium]|nr:hypothetical protein [Candidatus Gottesmanbacteria bacterium]